MVPKGIDPKQTENFLLTLPEVLDASVWFADQGLMAHVTVTGDKSITARKLQSECMHRLGLHQTPREVYLIWSNQLVA
jgi:hypothetical protein